MPDESQPAARQDRPDLPRLTPESFGAFYYAHDCGIPYERNEHWLTFFGAVADGIVERLRPTTVLDVGCAMGFLVEALRDRGVEAWGVDVSRYAIGNVHESVVAYCAVARADGPLPPSFPSSYDLVTCVEVIEHMDPAAGATALANLGRWGKRVLFSSSPTDYGEPTHMNVKRGESWAADFATCGMLRNFDVDVSFLTPWAVLFEHATMTPESVVARYEREYAEARREAIHLRHRLLDSERARGELEGVVKDLERKREELESSSAMDRLAAERVAETTDRLVAADLRAQQLRQQVTQLQEQVDQAERSLWEVLGELERARGNE